MDIRLYTRCVIWKDGEYLQGVQMLLGGLKYSTSPWDAWHTRKLNTAFRVAWRIGGTVKLFNPILGRVAPLRPLTEQKAVNEYEMRTVS